MDHELQHDGEHHPSLCAACIEYELLDDALRTSDDPAVQHLALLAQGRMLFGDDPS